MESALYISIIIPVYNRCKLLQRCLDSVAQNTLAQDKYEVIVVDDCSTDGTQEAIKNYKKILNYRYILRETNSGTASVPRNDGISHARGQYIYFIDSDDYITNQTLEDGLSFALANDSDMVCLPSFSEGRSVATSMYKKTIEDVILDKSTLINNLAAINKLIRKSIISSYNINFPEHAKRFEDNLFTIKCYSVAQKISILTGKKYYFAAPRSSDNLSASPFIVDILIHTIVQGCIFIIKTSRTHQQKINIITLFFNRMINGSYKKIDPKALSQLSFLEDKYGILSQIADNPLLTKPYIIHGILENDINYIKTLAQYTENRYFNNKVFIREGKAILEYIHNNILEYKDISYINPITIYIASISHSECILSLEFYIFDSFFPDEKENDICLRCQERKNMEKHVYFDVAPVEKHKNRYISHIDLSFLCLSMKDTIDIYVCTNRKGFSKTTRLGKNKINIENKLNIPRTEKDIFINNTQHMITVYETLGGYLAISIATK